VKTAYHEEPKDTKGTKIGFVKDDFVSFDLFVPS